jgi:hypothetical protein
MELTTPNQIIINVTPNVSIPYTHQTNFQRINNRNKYNFCSICNKCCKCFNKFLDLPIKFKIIILLIILITLALLGFIIYAINEFIKVFS